MALQIIKIALVIISVLLVLVIAIQNKQSGLSITPGMNETAKFERRGPEKVLHAVTIVLASLFVVLSSAFFFLA